MGSWMYYGLIAAIGIGGAIIYLLRNRENPVENIVRVVPSVSERNRALEQWILGRLGAGSKAYLEPSPDADAKQLAQDLIALSGSELPAVREALEGYMAESVAISRMLDSANTRRAEAYDSENEEHEALLQRLWELYRPGVRLSGRISDDWQEIGFQGRDPATDFRGMGVLGLDHLIEFARYHPEAARAVLADATKHKNWFSFAITGLNITADVFNLTKSRRANAWYYRYGASVDSMQRLHATLFVTFNQAWKRANPPNVMSFKEVHDDWLSDTITELARGTLQPLPRSVATDIFIA